MNGFPAIAILAAGGPAGGGPGGGGTGGPGGPPGGPLGGPPAGGGCGKVRGFCPKFGICPKILTFASPELDCCLLRFGAKPVKALEVKVVVVGATLEVVGCWVLVKEVSVVGLVLGKVKSLELGVSVGEYNNCTDNWAWDIRLSRFELFESFGD